MSGTRINVNSLAIEKQRLLLESELNRQEIAKSWGQLRQDTRLFIHHAGSIGTVAGAVLLAYGGYRTVRGANAKTRPQKVSALSRCIGFARMALSIWVAVRKMKRPVAPSVNSR